MYVRFQHYVRLPRLRPPILARPFRRAALHLLDRVALPVCTRYRIVALRVSLFAAEAVLFILLRTLGVGLAVAAVAATAFPAFFRLLCVVELDVEEVFFICGLEVGAGAFYAIVSTLHNMHSW
jgi:hypothetical protein